MHYDNNEHEWSFLSGLIETIDNPVEGMTDHLALLPYKPETIDARALVHDAIEPHTLRA
ncbi:hypothetical protein ACL02S_04830 [Nocardia sp. 004]|uniref:hypothetical protein n=1 Tax=Nocardia sp. 004 TaxID=3385978 RepID=UPI0039A20D50